MGTISDKLMRVINTKEDIRKALISKGYDVPTSIPFKEYAKMISDLPCKVDDFPKLPGDVTRWHFGGLTNEMMAAMDDPRIEDADHKGRFLSFKNFAWSGMSGVGGYVQDFNYFRNNATVDKIRIDEQSNNSIKVTILNTEINNAIYIPKNIYQFNKSYFIKISSEGYNEGDLSLSFYAPSTSTATTVKVPLNPNGITEIPAIKEDDFLAVYLDVGGKVGSITIEQLSLYPGFILGDGVDDFAVTEKELNFEGTYTVYTAFIPFQDDPTRTMELCGKHFKKDFYLSYTNTYIAYYTSGLNSVVPARINQFNIIVCKRDKTNAVIKNLITGESKTFSVSELINNPGVYYLWRYYQAASYYAKAAIAGQIIDNGHFTTDEEDENILDWHKKQYPWLFPGQAWTVTGKTNEDEDRTTIANITGNGNDLVLSNLGFAEGSGYGLYAYNFNSFSLRDNVVKPTDVKKDSFRMIGTGNSNNVLILLNESDSADWKIRITGMKEGDRCLIGNANKSGEYISVNKDGTYTFQKQYAATSTNGIWYNSSQEVDVLVEQIPEYEGYLVTDGVDDKIVSSSFEMGKDFTIVGDWKFIDNKKSGTGLVKGSSFYIYNTMIGLDLYINSGSVKNSLDGIKSINAACSDGRAYDRNWNEILANTGNVVGSGGMLEVSSSGGRFDRIAFKNLAIYLRILSKDDCIKAYNYLQTLKSK